ncbi:glycosyltransferase family 9 protein [Comamonas sp.]|uniref:glycosyltransferase family 9 protein n=1 Tax=Comamonas sp. TaxID=34028 RepID=UPI0028A0D280|nr:glycosyltransferase family 9 protein [Comamonas sp.]
MTSATGALAPRRVAVFRALMLGDMLVATPALRAVRAAWPQAEITLVGLPWAEALADRLDSIDRFEPFAGWPGLPEVAEPTLQQRERFLQRMRARHFDLVLQLHGSGGIVNAMLAQWQAGRLAGFCEEGACPGGRDAPDAPDAALFLRWPDQGHELQRLLALTRHLGLPATSSDLDFPLHAADYQRAHALVPRNRRYVIVHVGSQLPSRRWPAGYFAEVADRLAEAGWPVVLTGTAAERELVASVASLMRAPCTNLCGQTDLWTLGALIDSAALLVCNDTGVSHIAAALQTPSVVAACGSDTGRWAPLDRSRHRVLAHALECRPCAHRVCPIGHPCAWGLSADTVAQAALELLTTGRWHTGPSSGAPQVPAWPYKEHHEHATLR